MDKFIRTECLLSTNEYEKIESYYSSDINSLFIEKEIDIDVEGEKFNCKVTIKGKAPLTNILLSIKITNSYKKSKNTMFYIENKSAIIGVREVIFSLKNGKDKDFYNFFIRIDREYDKLNLKDKDFNKLKLLRANGHLNPELICKEILYQDFSNECSIALASYCLFANSKLLLEESKEFELYEEKLNFNGIFLEDFISSSIKDFKYFTYLKFVNDCETKTEVLELMLKYIATIKYNTPYFDFNINDFLSLIGYELYSNYLEKK